MAHENIWENVHPFLVKHLVAACVDGGGSPSVTPTASGAYTIVCSLPNVSIDDASDTGGSGTSGSSAVAPIQPTSPHSATNPHSGDFVDISVSETDLEALSKLAQSEVGHFSKYGSDQLRGALAAVVDTVVNRVAYDGFQNTILAAIDQPKQFSAINSVGSWTGLPAASLENTQIVEAHVQSRAGGANSAIKGATHFLNPYHSSASALNTWGNYVKENAVAVYGSDAAKDVHFHGFPPGGRLPRAYSLSYGGVTSRFTARGESVNSSHDFSGLANIIVKNCEDEHAFFEFGKKKEVDDPQYKRVGKYWEVLGLPYTGKNTGIAWSSAFISFVMSRSGVGDDFLLSQAHCHYFQNYARLGGEGAYAVMHASEAQIKPGDIVHYGREYAKRFTLEEAQTVYSADSFYPSHSDIVVAVANNSATTIGGNVSNSVAKKTLQLDQNGRLHDRTEGNATYPWIGVLSLNG